MSAPGTHQTTADDDLWSRVLDRYRCGSVDERRRCQLYRGHDGQAHAHAAPPPTAQLPVHRWSGDGERWTEQPGYGMR